MSAAAAAPHAVLDFAHALVAASIDRTLHGRTSAHVERSLRALVDCLHAAIAAGVEMPLQLQFTDDTILHRGEPLLAPSLQAQDLLTELSRREIAALAFGEALDADEVNRLFDLLLVAQNLPALRRGYRDRALRAFGIVNVRVMSRSPADPGDRRFAVAAVEDLHRYQDLAATLQHNHGRAARDRHLAVDRTNQAIEMALLRLETEPSGLLALAAQDNVDRFTVGHSVRVALLALQVARAAGASREQLVEVGTAALLHDIGKSKVPQEILFKQGRLVEEEWLEMARHPRLGAEILLEQDDLDPTAVGAAFCHHLRADGTGYPRPHHAVAPSGTSRLVRVCDVFEALTSVRPYKKALSPTEAYAVMCRNEVDFDQRWLRFFIRTLGVFPQGSRVQLDDGSQALVVRHGRRPDRPVVRLLAGPDAGELPAGTPDEITIGEPTDGVVRHVQSILTHDRTVELPVPDHGPEYLTQTVHGACLRSSPGH